MEVEDVYNELVDFGTVNCGTKFTRFVKIKNKSTIDQTYTVEKYTDRPRLETGFSVKPSASPLVKPNEEFTFTVEFVPITVNIRSCDTFLIRHLYGVHCVIVTKAIVKGPECSISCSKLQLLCPNDQKKVSKQFDLKNNGQCSADFQFTVGDNTSLSIQPQQGTISPSTSIHITIIYTPTNKKCYFKRIFCLISNHEPLILDVRAVWFKSAENMKPKIIESDLPTYVNGYHCYFYDVMPIMPKEERPLVSLDKSYVDFGHCQPKNSKKIEFSVTNNSNHKLSLVWNQGISTKEFQIQPSEAELDLKDCKTFSAMFKPVVRDKLFNCLLEAQAFTNEGLLPIPVEINLKGHSFDELSCGWTAQYRVEPAALVLPPCVASPFCPSHATLTIHRRGHLPLAFRFHPPPLTNFSVKPPQGVIRGGFQIVVVQYLPDTLREAVDTETWLLAFNSNEDVNQCIVKFGCSIETPHVIINHGNDIQFPSVHPGTEYNMSVDVYNPTRFSFWFMAEVEGAALPPSAEGEGEDEGEGVLAAEGAGEVWPYEHYRLPLTFRPRGHGELNARLGCRPVLGDEVAGRATSAAVVASCCQTLLTVHPNKLLLKKVIRDFAHKRVIEVTNSGDATINGSFAWEPDEHCSEEDFAISMDPPTFFLKPGDSQNVEVAITPFDIGEKSFTIKYSSNGHNLTLLPVIVDSVFPTLQITDIRTTNTAPLFNKRQYWKMMQINKFNHVLAHMRQSDSPEAVMNLPSCMNTARPSCVELLVENASELAARLTVRAAVSCDCAPVKRQTGLSISKWDRNCPHKGQVLLGPPVVQVEAGSYAILKMDVSYETIGEVESHFLLHFTPEDYEELGCSVKLRVSRNSIPKHTPFVDTIEPRENGDWVFNMRPVYIGDIKPFAQGFQLYNTTKQYMNFKVDDSKLIGTPFKYIGEKDQVPALSNHNLLFTFLPYRCITYEAETTVIINNNCHRLLLRGTGVSDPRDVYKDEDNFPKMNKLDQLSPSNVSFSTPHINIGPIKPKCTLKDVFFINNNTKDIVSFVFLSTRMADVVHLRVAPAKGLIQPGGSVECQLACHCAGRPCWLDLTLACAHASFSQYAANVQRLNRYHEDLVSRQNDFTITEKGSETATITPPTENWPVKSYLTIGVTVNVKEGLVNGQDDILPVCPLVVEGQRHNTLEMLEAEDKFLITDVLERLLWQVLEESFRSNQASNDHSSVQVVDESYPSNQASNDQSSVVYQQIKNMDIQTEMRVPDYVTQNILEDILHSTWQDVFQLGGYKSCELFRRCVLCQTSPDPRVGPSSSGNPTLASISDSFILWSGTHRLSSKKS